MDHPGVQSVDEGLTEEGRLCARAAIDEIKLLIKQSRS